MTAAFLQSELASLIQDSKRRQSDVRTAAEKSLADLKAIQVTSETQLAGDLQRRLQFIDPFVLACNSKHVKLAVTGAVCLQRLVASKAIPSTRLVDVLDAFQEAAQHGFDVQLKVLQAMPSLLQLYAPELRGETLGKVLSLCASLAGSKTAMAAGTAIATFQQLITALFEKQARPRSDEDNDIGQADDAENVFNDMCIVVGGEQSQFLRTSRLTVSLALEVVELSLANPKITILQTPSCLAACKDFLVPGIIQILERSPQFGSFGRSLRILYLLIRERLDQMLVVQSQAMATILNVMDRPTGPAWRRVLCLEFMRNLASDFQLFQKIYFSFDCSLEPHRVVGSFMSILVRIAAEDPALIGLGRQSTIPTNSEDDNNGIGGTHVEVDAVGSVLQANSSVTGISSKWSTITTPLLEQLDRQVSPDIPETYIYTLVLGCVASLSDGLSKYIMPLSVPNRVMLEAAELEELDGSPKRKNSQIRKASKNQRLMNPLKRDDLTGKEEIKTCAKLIEDCWPAVLATCSTFLNSALDSYFYHTLVRTVQKLAQVSGVLELFTPRDALLTTLAKVSVPVNASTLVGVLHSFKLARLPEEDEEGEGENASIKSPIPGTSRSSVDVSRQPLNVRNLLCLRALLNLGIALGPTLSETSWFIIIQVLQQADALMSVNPATRNATAKSQVSEDAATEGQTNLGSEITAVGTASKRMLESTRTYPDDVFEIFLSSIFKLIDRLVPYSKSQSADEEINGKQELRVVSRQHKPSRSVSGAPTTAPILHVEVEFVLKTVNDLSRVNLHRFCSNNSKSCTWDFIITRLLSIIASSTINPQLRLQAAGVINAISVETTRTLEKQNLDFEELDSLQVLCLQTLAKQINLLYKGKVTQSVLVTDVDIHRRLLEALENVVSNSGESLNSGWRIVFEILQKTTKQTNLALDEDLSNMHVADKELVLERTIPPAFRTVQLVASDFLNIIDPQSFSILVQLLPSFGAQKNDLNISLTTTALFANLSSLLLERTDTINLPINHDQYVGIAQASTLTSDRTATDVSSLWFTIVLQLCILCRDIRSDVRNSALRVLVRIYESASPQLTPNTWNVSFLEAFLPLLKDYTDQHEDPPAWHDSYTQLLQGVANLFVQNAEIVTKSSALSSTWESLVLVLNTKLREQTLDGNTAVFSAGSELIHCLYSEGVATPAFIFPLLRLWTEYQSARLSSQEKSNQDAICAHALFFKAAVEDNADSMKSFSVNEQGLVEVALNATKLAVLGTVHPPYSSDVAKLSAEQIAITQNLKIIRRLMSDKKRDFSDFLIDIIDSILTRNTATDIEKQKIIAGPRSFKRPTLIAFMSHCISTFRDVVQTERKSEGFIHNASVEASLCVLTRVAETKYTAIPSSGDSPVWQNATAAVIELVEAIQTCKDVPSETLKSLSQPLVRALEAVITAPALEEKEPKPSAEMIIKDEAFDILHFSRFHRAALSLIRFDQYPEQDRRQYMTILFQASLIAKTWFGDMPPDLLNSPLSTFQTLRLGSIRPPDFYPRTKMPYEIFNAMLNLVDVKHTTTDDPEFLTTARAAAPYVLLRIAHAIKVFLVDQRLRNLTPPPSSLQHELHTVLNKALPLRVIDEAFTTISPSASAVGDGKSHLRILYPLVLKLKVFWAALPRLKICPWQDSEDGKGVQMALDSWGDVLAEAWLVGS